MLMMRKQQEQAPQLSLRTRDRESGNEAVHTLNYRQHDNRYVVVAVSAGDASKPEWYLNLKKKPIVEVELEGNRFFARAETPVGSDRLSIWPLVSELSDQVVRERPRNVTGVLLTPLG